jgi:hypothetical protein
MSFHSQTLMHPKLTICTINYNEANSLFDSCLSLLRSLTLWWGADDVMLQILDEVCPALQQLDLWKSARVTDLGLRALLGLNSEADESPTGGFTEYIYW